MDSFAVDDPLFGGVSAEGGFPGGRGHHSFEEDLLERVLNVNFVTPLASPLVHRETMDDKLTFRHPDDRTHASDRTLASFGATIMSVGSQSGDHSFVSGGQQRTGGNSSVFSNVRSGMHLGDHSLHSEGQRRTSNSSVFTVSDIHSGMHLGDHSLQSGGQRRTSNSSVFTVSDIHSEMHLGDHSLQLGGQRRTSSSSVFSDVHSGMHLGDHSLQSGGQRRTSSSSVFSDIHSGIQLGDHSLQSGDPRRTSSSSVFSDVHSGILSVGEDLPPRMAFVSSRHEGMNTIHSLPSSLNQSGDVLMTEESVLVDPWMPTPLEPGFPGNSSTNNNGHKAHDAHDHFPVADFIASSSSFSDQFSNSLQVSGAVDAPSPPSSLVPTTKTYTPMNYNNRSEGKPSVIKSMKTKTKQRKEQGMVNGRQIRRLIAENGTQHVYFGRGEPIRNNPGNIRFRSIIDKYYGEYQRATKKVKLEIRNRIEDEVKSDGSMFIVVVENKGNVSQQLASDSKVKDGTGHALRDTPKRRANYWSWLDPSEGQPSWTTFANKDGAALEQMFQECPHARTNVHVTVRKEDHLVDVSSMIMHRAINGNTSNDGNLIYHVRRLEPEEYSEAGEQIDVADGDGQYDARSSASQTSGASGNSSTGSSSRPFGGGGVFGGVQSSLYCSLGMANQGKSGEMTVSAYEAVQEEIFEAITSALEGEMEREEPVPLPTLAPSMSASTGSGVFSRREARAGEDEDDDDVSALQPPPRSTDLGAPSGGGLRSGLVKRIKNKVKFGSQISLNFGKKKEQQSEADQNSKSQTQEVIWLWRENKTRMDRHSIDAIEGDPNDCWVRYDEASSAVLEASYKAQNGIGECVASPKYTVDFGLMRQINIETGFQRQVRRVESTSDKAQESEPDGSSTSKTVPGITGKVISHGSSIMRVNNHQADDMTIGENTAPTSADESTTVGLEEEMVFRRQANVN